MLNTLNIQYSKHMTIHSGMQCGERTLNDVMLCSEHRRLEESKGYHWSVLSKIQFCYNTSRELDVIYQHLSKWSLRDHMLLRYYKMQMDTL
jgi:hypothetical protein